MEKSRLICFLRVWHFLLWHTQTHIQVYLHPHMHHRAALTHSLTLLLTHLSRPRKEMLGPLELGVLYMPTCTVADCSWYSMRRRATAAATEKLGREKKTGSSSTECGSRPGAAYLFSFFFLSFRSYACPLNLPVGRCTSTCSMLSV